MDLYYYLSLVFLFIIIDDIILLFSNILKY